MPTALLRSGWWASHTDQPCAYCKELREPQLFFPHHLGQSNVQIHGLTQGCWRPNQYTVWFGKLAHDLANWLPIHKQFSQVPAIRYAAAAARTATLAPQTSHPCRSCTWSLARGQVDMHALLEDHLHPCLPESWLHRHQSQGPPHQRPAGISCSCRNGPRFPPQAQACRVRPCHPIAHELKQDWEALGKRLNALRWESSQVLI